MAKVTGLTAAKMLEIQTISENAKDIALSSIEVSSAARDAAVQASEAAQAAITLASESANAASASAQSASDEADRAELAAQSVDMDAINSRLSAMDASLAGKASLVSGKVPFSQLATSQSATQDTIPSRASNGRLPGIGTPTGATDAAPKGYVDNILSAVDADLADYEAQFARKDDLMFSLKIDTFVDGQTSTSGAIEVALMALPVDIEILAVCLTWDDPINIAGTNNSCNARIVFRPNTAASATNVVQMSSETQRMGGSSDADRRKVWNMKNGTWGTKRVPAGNVLSFVLGSVKGSINFTLPMTVTIMYRPV